MIIIHEGDEKLLYFFAGDIYLLDYADEKVTKLTFEEFIRYVDTLPDEGQKWKRYIIVRMAEFVGMLKGAA